MRCDNCVYFSATLSKFSALKATEGAGECRRRAPHGPFVVGKSDGKNIFQAIVNPFVPVAVDDWCGEFNQKGE